MTPRIRQLAALLPRPPHALLVLNGLLTDGRWGRHADGDLAVGVTRRPVLVDDGSATLGRQTGGRLLLLLLLLPQVMMVIDGGNGMCRTPPRGGPHLLRRGSKIERLLRLLHSRTLAGLQPGWILDPLVSNVLVRPLRQLVGGLEQRHVGRRPDRRRRIWTDADAVRGSRRRQLHVVARQQEHHLTVRQPGGYDLHDRQHIGILLRRGGLMIDRQTRCRMVRMVRIQRRRVHLAEGGGWPAAVVVLVAGGGAAVGSGRLHLRNLGLDQAGRCESRRGAAMGADRASDVMIQRARAGRAGYTVRHAAWAAAQAAVGPRTQVQIQLRHAAVQVAQ